MAEITHRFITTNGIKMHLAEAGVGRSCYSATVFPESWYSWRHQLRALGGAGFHAVAPDMRDYGQTGRPKDVEAYDNPTDGRSGRAVLVAHADLFIVNKNAPSAEA